MKELNIHAEVANLDQVLEFVEEGLSELDVPMKTLMQINLAVEEVFVNIASYAYAPGEGDAVIVVDSDKDKNEGSITFIDKGIPYNPLAKEDPDVTLSAEQRDIGGLGIFLTKKVMDDVVYEHKDGQNILKLVKRVS